MKRATSKDVARLAGVSQTTVSFVMNNTPGVSLSDETRRRVIEAARELQYIPNSFAKGLKTSQSRLLGVFLPSMDNPFYPMLMKYIEKYTVGLSYNVMLCCTYRNPEREKAYLDLCIEKQVDGIIYLFTPNWLKRAVQISHSIPIVLISEKSDDVPLNTISMNGFRCGELLANHLLELGHRRLAYILSPVTSISMTRRMRLEGIQSAVEKAGLPPDALQVLTAPEMPPDGTEADAGYILMDRLLREGRVTGGIGVNDLVAFGALSCALTTPGLQLPRDLSICGFDNIYLSAMARPGLTTVDYCTESLCKLAVDMVLNGTGDSSILKLSSDPQLVVRGSTGPAPAKPPRSA